MNRELPSSETLASYIDRYCDESISSKELTELEQWLSNNDAALEQFLLRMEIHSALAWPRRSAQGTDASSDEKNHPSPGTPILTPVTSGDELLAGLLFPCGESPLSRNEYKTDGLLGSFMSLFQPPLVFVTSLVLVLGSVLATYHVLRHDDSVRLNQLAAKPLPPATAAAYLMVDNGVVWGGNKPVTRHVGSPVLLGNEISVAEGIAEFRLANGANLSVEGPTSLVLASQSTLVLQYGKLTAHVGWSVTDFKVIAGACQFTACDAEFGLLQEGNKVDVHVFSGEVQAESPQKAPDGQPDLVGSDGLVVDSTGNFTKGAITAGNALSLASEGDQVKVAGAMGRKATPEKFAAKLSMAGPLPVTKAYVDAVLASKPVGYWRFESTKGDVIKNEVAGGNDLNVLGDVRFMGEPNNYVVDYQPNLVGRFRTIDMDDFAGSGCSLEVWVKPSHVHRGVIMALYRFDSGRYRATSLELCSGVDRLLNNRPGVVHFAHQASFESDESKSQEASCYSKKQYAVRRWQHIVAVKETNRIRLYVDGKPSQTASDPTTLTSKLGFSVGRNPAYRERRFVGQLDEVAIYNRALTSKEIARHYQIIEAAFKFPPPHLPRDSRESSHRSTRPAAGQYVFSSESGDES
jgi:hypothetical protein